MCCQINRCCFCFEHFLGVKVLACLLILIEVTIIVVGTLYLPQFLFAIAPTSSIGIFCDIFLLVAVIKTSRWLVLPWLIYIMIIIVALGLAAVLRIVIPLGAVRNPDWLIITVTSLVCLAVAGLLLYFWIVVLELFIRLAPTSYPGGLYGQPPMQMGHPSAAYAAGPGIPIQYGAYSGPATSMIYQPGPAMGPQMMR